MTDDYKTLRVPEEAWQEAKAQKEAAGRTWGEQIVRDGSDMDVSADTLERFTDLRERCQTDHTPAPTADGMLNSLMDEWERDRPLDGEMPELGDGEVAIVTNNHETAERLADAIEAAGGGGQTMLDQPETLGEVKELVERIPERTADQLASEFGR